MGGRVWGAVRVMGSGASTSAGVYGGSVPHRTQLPKGLWRLLPSWLPHPRWECGSGQRILCWVLNAAGLAWVPARPWVQSLASSFLLKDISLSPESVGKLRGLGGGRGDP